MPTPDPAGTRMTDRLDTPVSPPAGSRRLRLLSANIQAGSSTRGYHDYVARSWSHVLPAGNKRGSLDLIARLAGQYDIVGLNEADPGSLRSGFTNQTEYLARHGGFDYWSHQPNRRVAGVASSANGLLSKLQPIEVSDHSLPGRISGRGVLLARFGAGDDGLVVAIAHLSLGANSRSAQLGFIAELLQDHRHAVLMGDFNCAIERPEMQALFRNTRLQPPACEVPTFPSWQPQRAIDHILISDGLTCSGAQAMAAAHSDHLALSLELDVPDAALQ